MSTWCWLMRCTPHPARTTDRTTGGWERARVEAVEAARFSLT